MIWRKGWIELRLHRWNGCFGKMDDHPDHTTPNHHPPKMDGLPKTFLKIILAAKCLVRHSSTCPNQQRWHLPVSLFLILFYADIPVIYTYLGYLVSLQHQVWLSYPNSCSCTGQLIYSILQQQNISHYTLHCLCVPLVACNLWDSFSVAAR